MADSSTDPDRSSTGSGPLFAVVGVTDLVVERIRHAAAGASAFEATLEARVTEFDPKTLRAQAQEAPLRAVGRALEAATRAEATYEQLARRGQDLLERVRAQSATQDLMHQAESTLSRGRAAVTVARKAADGTASAILDTLGVGRTEATEAVEKSTAAAEEAVSATGASARRTNATRKRATGATKSAAKGVRTSSAKTAASANSAAKRAAKKVGE